jgi:hypothetical protein
VAFQEFLGEGLGAFEPRRGLPRAEAAQARGRERIDHAGHERRLGADDREPDLLRTRQRHETVDVLGLDGHVADARLGRGAAVAGRHEHFGDVRGLRAFPCQRVFATAGTCDEDLHGPA